MIRSKKALQQLKDGNTRFVEGKSVASSLATESRRNELVDGQHPSAIILGCSDSRAPAEIIFDQGLGELFVIRVAGNIVAPPLIGSVEYAVENVGTRLIVVLGHTGCGAVAATISQLKNGGDVKSPNLKEIVDGIHPSVLSLLEENPEMDSEVLLSRAVRNNIQSSVEQLRQGSETLQHFIDEDSLVILGAEYSLETGVVEFFE